jgi:hypothetical protein
MVVLVATVTAAAARDIKLTIYDDGLSCPADCDAHVVVNPADNGTRYAFRPDSNRAHPAACTLGQDCRICFSDGDDSCMTVTYRGGGPPVGTFDFTPAFYAANCARSDIPAALKRQCAALDAAVARLGYDKRVNCLATPSDQKCLDIVAKAKAARDLDVPKRQKCLDLGQANYNRTASPAERRANDCNYSLARLGGSGNRRWQMLLPGACREGTYVDRFGLDCCSADLRFAAENHPECLGFFPKKD